MSIKFDFNNLSGIIFKEEEDSADETINNINLELGDNNYIKTNLQRKLNKFEDAINFAKNKFDNLCKKSDKISSPKFVPEILKDNIHLQYIFKNINKVSDMTKTIEIKKNLMDEDNNQNSFNSIEEKTKETNSSDKRKNNIKNDINNYSDQKLNNNFKDIKKNIFFFNDDKIFTDNFEKNIYSDKLKLIPSYDINQLFNNNNLNVNANKKQNLNFIGKKRGNKENNEKQTILDIFNEIKILYDKYIGKGPEYKLYEQGFFDKNITVVEKGIPTCIIYFNRKLEKIYLIKEQKFLEDENEIIEILDFIKNNILKYKNLNPFDFKKK